MLKMETFKKLEDEIRELKKKNKELEVKVAHAEKERDDYRYSRTKEAQVDKNYLQLFGGYGDGIKIPFDADMKKAIGKLVYDTMYDIMHNDTNLQEKFIKVGLSYKNSFISIFKPIVKEMLEDMDFTVNFEANK